MNMKVAIYGVWHVHAGGYTRKAMEMGEVVGFYEKNDAFAESFQKEFNIPRFSSPEELLKSDAEGVIVCSASNEHKEDMVKIANAGKHIFTEKVLALTDEDCFEVEKAVKANNVQFVISLFQKYIGARIAVKNVADSGELGKINYMRFRNCHSGSLAGWLPPHFFNKEQCGGGAMIDLGAHGMYLTHWILGLPVSAKSVFTIACENEGYEQKNIDNVEDNAVTVMQFSNGAIAINETGFVSDKSPTVLEVHGENGFVRMEGNAVVKCTKETDGATVAVEIPDSLPSPLEQFLSGNVLGGCGMEEAKALTHMMVMAYGEK